MLTCISLMCHHIFTSVSNIFLPHSLQSSNYFLYKNQNSPCVDKTRGKGGCRVEEDKDEKREGLDLASMRMDD